MVVFSNDVDIKVEGDVDRRNAMTSIFAQIELPVDVVEMTDVADISLLCADSLSLNDLKVDGGREIFHHDKVPFLLALAGVVESALSKEAIVSAHHEIGVLEGARLDE